MPSTILPFRERPERGEPYIGSKVKRLLRAIMGTGQLRFSLHGRQEMEADHLQATDVVSVLRGGAVEGHDLERGTWRYRVSTQRMCVVVAFRSEESATVVTAWRIK